MTSGLRHELRRRLPLIRAVVTVVLLGWLFSRIPLAEVAGTLGRVRAAPLAAAVLAAIATHLVASLRLRLVARHHGFELGVAETCRLNFAAIFYGLTVPGGNLAGGAVRIYRLGDGTRPLPAAAAVLADRLHATFAALLVGSVCWVLDPAAGPASVGMTLAAATVALPVLYLLFRSGGPLPGRLPEKWRNAVGREAGAPVAEATPLVALSLLAQALGLGALVIIAVALGLDVPAVTIGWVRSAVMLVVMLPISISGFGVREGALVALLGRYGVPAEEALAFSLLMFAVLTLVNGLVGGILEGWQALRPAVARR